ncbi:MAG TPA: hypothetical protein VHI77_09965 [Solirubrobacterales bacterium]|jgi:hypothetical protein|nr:hypothetical protein [Solirubrobacterales bacterium]
MSEPGEGEGKDLGAPGSYMSVRRGVPVYTSDGECVGQVVECLSAPNLDMFDGIIFDTTRGPGGHRFVDAPEVGEIFERGVVLKIDAAEAAKLPAPGKNPGVLAVGPDEMTKDDGRGRMRRLWSRLTSGRH